MQKSIILLLLIISSFSYAQQSPNSRCQSTEAMNVHFKKHPELKQQFDTYQTLSKTSLNASKIAAVTNYTIPVVFHVLHLNGNENISDAQVEDAVNNLNIDYLFVLCNSISQDIEDIINTNKFNFKFINCLL